MRPTVSLIRWVLVLPIALICALFTSSVVGLASHRFADSINSPGVFGDLLRMFFGGLAFTVAGMAVAPAERRATGIVLALLMGGFAVLMAMAMSAEGRLSVTDTWVAPGLLAAGAAAGVAFGRRDG